MIQTKSSLDSALFISVLHPYMGKVSPLIQSCWSQTKCNNYVIQTDLPVFRNCQTKWLSWLACVTVAVNIHWWHRSLHDLKSFLDWNFNRKLHLVNRPLIFTHSMLRLSMRLSPVAQLICCFSLKNKVFYTLTYSVQCGFNQSYPLLSITREPLELPLIPYEKFNNELFSNETVMCFQSRD